jgi:peptide/nickel transport system permease protein
MSPSPETIPSQSMPVGVGGDQVEEEERIYVVSQWGLMWLHFKKHRLALLGGGVVVFLYALVLFGSFVAPYDKLERTKYVFHPPQSIHFFDGRTFHLRPFVYGIISQPDRESMRRVYVVDRDQKYPVRLFVRGFEYRLLGLFPTDIHLFGAEGEGQIFLMGTDELGRDLFSRVLSGATISLSIGFLGVFSSFFLGTILGGISGYYGGAVDNIIQRVIEFLITMPSIPLWMGLSAAVPIDWPAVRVYFAITLVLSLRGWCGLARVVRGKMLEVREEDFVMAARLGGATDWHIITRHMIPAFMSYLIVSMTLSVPNMIVGETALSFLGLGLRPPVVSWGVLLQKAQNIRTVSIHPWLLIPAIFVIVTVLAFNFMGDGLRDAADPYKL